MIMAIKSHYIDGSQESQFFNIYLQKPKNMLWQPGQFVMIRLPAWKNAMWARPFSICAANEDILTLACQVVGRTTKELSALSAGDKVCFWGPLGKGFEVDKQAPTLLLAGGIGLAPFIGYCQEHPNPHNLRLEFGHRAPLFCYPMTKLPDQVNASAHLEQSPEDLQAFLSLIDNLIADYAQQNGLVLACGPLPFLKFVQEKSLLHKARARLSVENRMSCGIGACLGCVVTSHGAKQEGWPIQACIHGPVFKAEQIALDDL
jgi:dihydroorotate dehydrogenase electron transfer subunit